MVLCCGNARALTERSAHQPGVKGVRGVAKAQSQGFSYLQNKLQKHYSQMSPQTRKTN